MLLNAPHDTDEQYGKHYAKQEGCCCNNEGRSGRYPLHCVTKTTRPDAQVTFLHIGIMHLR